MASLKVQIENLAIAVGTRAKLLLTLINGNTSTDLSGLNTTAKGNLVAAINEVLAAAGAGGADASTTVKGIVELLTDAEAIAATDTVRAMTAANLAAVLAGKAYAPLASPALTGNPTTPNQAAGSNNTRVANTAYVDSAVSALIASAPGVLDTLDEIAAALGDDPNFAASMTTLINGKQPLDADLTAIAALTSAANKGLQSTGAGTWALYDLTAAGKALLDDADAAAQRVTLDVYGKSELGVVDTDYAAAFTAALV